MSKIAGNYGGSSSVGCVAPLLGCEVGRGGGTGTPSPWASAAGAASPLDQEGENRKNGGGVGGAVEWFNQIKARTPSGSVILAPERSGGSFDPMGCRAVDVTRRQDLISLVESLPGRWVLVTLTVDRRAFINPEAAYQAVQDRVRYVMAGICPSRVWFAALEVQTKTGEGWPHWHAVAWVPDDRSCDELKRVLVKRWHTIHEHVCAETGEVTRSKLPIGIAAAQDVQEAREAKAVGVYISKYVTKPWDVVPEWMGDSTRRTRKVRLSGHSFDVLADLGRHVRHRGSRRISTPTARRQRTLYQRMAASGQRCKVLSVEGDRLVYRGMLEVPFDQRLPELLEYRCDVVVTDRRLKKCRLAVPAALVSQLRRERGPEFVERRRERLASREWRLRAAWRDRGKRNEGPDLGLAHHGGPTTSDQQALSGLGGLAEWCVSENVQFPPGWARPSDG